MVIFRNKFYISLSVIFLFILIASLCIYFSYNAIPIGTDNGNVFIESRIYLEEGFDRGYSSLQPLITTIINAIFLSISNNFPLILLSGIFSILIALLVFRFIQLEIGITAAILSLALFLLSPLFFERTWYLAPYPLSLFFITSSIFIYLKLDKDKAANLILLIISAFFMALAVYTWTLALTMIAIPILYHILCRSVKNNIRLIFGFYASILIFMLTWMIWHLEIGGIQHFYFNSYGWYSVKYLPMVNKLFWGYGGLGYSNIPKLFSYYGNFLSLIWENLFIGIGLIFSILGLLKIEPRLRSLCIVWIIIAILPLLILQTAAFDRYLYFTLPPFIILASYGLAYLLKSLNGKLKIGIILLVLLVCFIQVPKYFDDFHESPSYPSPNSASIQDINLFREIINDNRNIYSRHHAFQYYFHDNYFIAFSDMSEEDAISFLSWESESAISTIMEKYNIGWIMLYKDESFEKDYYIWVKEVTGEYTKHYLYISESPNFEMIYYGRIYIFYKYIAS